MVSRVLHGDGSTYDVYTGIAYDIVAVCIFFVVSITFFFPVNRIFPLDRRSVAVVGATLCYLSGAFLFPQHQRELENSVDFDVLVLLSGIMAINFIVVHQSETKALILSVQNQINLNPKKGFWVVSFAAFITSPFLTNDGICLLFVEPILNAFISISSSSAPPSADQQGPDGVLILQKRDAFYFLITLACSSNIGSALTYTGNPQNMIVAEDAIDVLPSYMFFLYMLVPSVLSWLLTTFWIERCWMKSRFMNQRMPSIFNVTELSNRPYALNPLNSSTHSTSDVEMMSSAHSDTKISTSLDPNAGLYNHMPTGSSVENNGSVARKISRIVNSPFPYGVLIISAIMVALIFVDLISIAGLICVFAVIMVIVTVLGNHWAGRLIWADENAPINRPLTAEEKALNTNEFFEELFNSIDYSLLLIFLGLFIVVEHLSSTGIPGVIWDSIVGAQPFDTFGSVFRISLFILIASQLIGNVPVIYLAKPNVEPLGDQEKAYAWAVISFVATIGGNLTITGSAANIIVAEKAVRIDPANEINFGNHFQICFFVTLICCFFGALIITGFMAINSDEGW